ncbi:hypothetical protein TNCV_588211 [Trichonephila clavipes]|nr:hypothetical protein TNCV_588211 [Trichonephila clavipes]
MTCSVRECLPAELVALYFPIGELRATVAQWSRVPFEEGLITDNSSTPVLNLQVKCVQNTSNVLDDLQRYWVVVGAIPL